MVLKIVRPERRVEVLLDGNLLADWEATNAAYKLAVAEEKKAKQDRRLNNSSSKKVRELLAKAERISAAARESTVAFRVQAVSRVKWDEYVNAYPVSDDDAPLPYDTKKVTDAVLSTPGAIVAVERLDGTPEKFTHDDWAEFAEQLSESQHDDFRVAVVNLNAGINEVPFLPESGETDDSGQNSKPQEGSGSHTEDSSDGSQEQSTSTTNKGD